MRLLDRYLLRELMVPLPYCLGGFLIFWISSDLLAEVDSFHAERLTARDLVEYYLVRVPDFLGMLLPLVLLLALLYALTTHARHQEFTAMRAAGQGLWRICLPYFAVGLLATGLSYVLNEVLAPAGKQQAERIRKRRLPGAGIDDTRWRIDLKFRNERDNRLWRIRAFHRQTGEMLQPYVEWERPDGSPGHLLAERAVYTNGTWLFLRGRLFDPNPDSVQPIEPFEARVFPELTETPELIRSECTVSQLSSARAARRVVLTMAEIRNYKYLHPELSGRPLALLDTQLQARLATPWTCLVVVLIAVPFGAASGRRNVFVGVAASIFIGVLYFFLQQISMGLGSGTYLPPFVAAWLPNVVFSATGLVLTARVR